MALYDKASLVLIPSGTKEGVCFSQKPTNGDGDFTFSRASAATRVNSDGLIEKETQNLLLQSNQFDTTWTNTGTTETGGQTGYDGSSDAWLLNKTTASGLIQQSASGSGVYTFSVYAKAGSLNWIRILIAHSSTNPQTYFDLSGSGAIGAESSVIHSNIESVGGGWFRCSIVGDVSVITALRIYPADGDGIVSGTSGNIYIQDAQLESGLVATDYIETTTAAVYGGITDNIPRLDYTDASCPSLLLEPQRTNLMVQSEGFSTSDWTDNKTSNTNVTANAAISPEGVQNATEIDFTTTGGAEILDKFTNVASSTHIASCWFKNGTIGQIFFQLIGGTPDILAEATINLSTGVLTDQVGSFTPTIEDYGNGWYRVAIGDLGNASIASPSFKIKQSGSNTGTFYVWGAQVEASSYPTSYIPTYGASVTRVGETCNNAGNSDLFNDSEGVLYAEIAALDDDLTQRHISISDGSTVDVIRIHYHTTSNSIRGQVRAGGTIQASSTYIVPDIKDFHKVALSYKENDVKLYIDGVLVSTDTSASMPTGLDELSFNRGDGGLDFYGKTNQVLYFPTALTDEELATLTTI